LGGKAAARGAAIMAERPLSDRRQALDRAIILRAAAEKAVATALEPLRRCEAVIAEVTRLRAELAELYQRDRRLTGEWIAAGRQGTDPGDAKDTRALNSQIVAMQGDVSAVEKVLPDKQAAHAAAIHQLTAADCELAAAIFDVALEAVEQRAPELLAKLNDALRVEASLRSVAAELRACGDRDGDNRAHAAATAVEVVIRRAREAAGVPQVDAGPQLLQVLATDPAAKLLP